MKQLTVPRAVILRGKWSGQIFPAISQRNFGQADPYGVVAGYLEKAKLVF